MASGKNTQSGTIYGTDGNDVLKGKYPGRAEELFGLNGDDTYIIDDQLDSVIEKPNGGSDLIQSSVDMTLPDNVEKLLLTGNKPISGTGNTLNNAITGNGADNVLKGSSGADWIWAGGGNDTLIGGKDGAADHLFGGAGDDSYYVNEDGDIVVEDNDQGVDVVYTTVNYELTANVEQLVIFSDDDIDGKGNALANAITGGGGNNKLDGAAGADTIWAGGGDDTLIGGMDGAVDQLYGGDGDDVYIVDEDIDLVIEEDNKGEDLVRSSISYKLTDNVENLELTGENSINGTGNDLDNAITGNGASNVLDGGAGSDHIWAGAGDDTLIGGKDGAVDMLFGGWGDDVYVVDESQDVVTEDVAMGTDTVLASITYKLGANVENLTLTGDAAIDGTGNGLDNVITGNGAANALYGLAGNDVINGGGGNDTLDGGTGADLMQGGEGGDDYYVDNVNDRIVEVDDGRVGYDSIAGSAGTGSNWMVYTAAMSAGAKTDRVFSTVDYTLTDHVEVLALRGNANINGTGNSLNNAITGNAGNNVLKGMGGVDQIWAGGGNDTLDGGSGDDWLDGGSERDVLTGGTGRDAFVFGAGFSKNSGSVSWGWLNSSSDTVTDFTKGEDIVVLSRNAFDKLNGGATLDAKSFLTKGHGSVTADTRVIYDQASGQLYYDADGSAGGFKQVLIATFNTKPVLDVSDFLLVS